jgi:hypothetical protein
MGGPTTYGPGDTELGVKYRFVHESDTLPQVGAFPLMELPTANEAWVAAICRRSFQFGYRKAGALGQPTEAAVTGSIPAVGTGTFGN